MDENTPDWLVKATEETDAMVRRVMPIVRATQRYAEDLRAAQAGAGTSLPSGRDLARAMGAGMREFLAVLHQRDVVVYAAPATAFASVPIPMVFVMDGDVVGADDREAPPVALTDVGMPLDAKTVFLAIVWVFALLLPLKIGQLSPDIQTVIRDYLLTVGNALIITWRVQDSRRHD